MITEQRLAEIKARHAAASAGTWFADAYDPFMVSTERGKDVADTQFCQNPQTGLANATFIAHARQDVPDLVAEVERLRVDLLNVAIGICKTAGDVVWAYPDEPLNNTTAFDLIFQAVGLSMNDNETPLDAVYRARAALEGGE